MLQSRVGTKARKSRSHARRYSPPKASKGGGITPWSPNIGFLCDEMNSRGADLSDNTSRLWITLKPLNPRIPLTQFGINGDARRKTGAVIFVAKLRSAHQVTKSEAIAHEYIREDCD